MSKPTKHHYLPVFYLSRWCDPGGKVTRYYRPHQKVIASPITPANTGYEPYLYTQSGVLPGQEQFIETDFMAPVIDDPAARVISIFIERTPEKLTPESRVDWTRFLMAMRHRDPFGLAEVTSLAQTAMISELGQPNDQGYLAAKKPNDPATLYEWIEKYAPHVIENVGKIFLPGLIDHAGIGNHMINMRWSSFDVSQGGVLLLTGDRPLVATTGLADPNCIVALPLTHDVLFVATNNEATVERLRAAPLARLAKAMNVNIVNQARKQVFGNSDRHLRFVENRLRHKGG